MARQAVEGEKDMSIEYLRCVYGVPAKRGGRVSIRGLEGTITGGTEMVLRVRLDDGRRLRLHPRTPLLKYL